MNDLSNTITPYLTVRDLIRDNLEDPKVLDMAVNLLEYFVDKQDQAFEKAWDKVVKTPVEDIEPCMPPWGHSDLEYDPTYSESTKMQIYKNYRAAIDEYNKLQERYETLLVEHGELQDLFYRVDSEHDELKVKYDQCQDNYHTVVKSLTKRDTFCSF
jgi:hypothetical protein